MEIYTMQDWERDGSLSVKVGQCVTDEIIAELAGCLPPAQYSAHVFQPGEAYDHDYDTGAPLYLTFERRAIGWEYIGFRP